MWDVRSFLGGRVVFALVCCIPMACYAQNEGTEPPSYVGANNSSEFAVETSQQPSPPKPMVSVESRGVSVLPHYLDSNQLKVRGVATLDVINNTEDVLAGIIWTKDRKDIAIGLDNGTTLDFGGYGGQISGITVCEEQSAPDCLEKRKSDYVTLQPKVPVRVSVTLLKEERRALLSSVAAAKTANFSAFLHIVDSNGDKHLLPLNLGDIPIKNSVMDE